ncbi:MAG TPA: hypothetical protein VNV88_09020 [Candidatus Solibacter sp.]|nr:hypothetical protein [Candidatus Solibacter sp.]
MRWISTTLALTAIFLVSLQGISLFARSKGKDHAVLGGTLNLFLAAGGLIAFFLFRAGALVASPEYGALLVQGTAARAWAYILLVGICVAGGIIALLPEKEESWLRNANASKMWLGRVVCASLLGLVVGIAAVVEFRNLNPSAPTPFCIRFYDMWWPPLLVWLVLCLSQWVAGTLGVLTPLGRVLWAAFSITGVGFLPIFRTRSGFQYGDPNTGMLWKMVVCAGVMLFMVFSPLVFMRSRTGNDQRGQRVRIVIAGLAGCAGLASAWYWAYRPGSQPSRIVPPLVLWAAWIIVFAAWTARQLRRGVFKLPALSPKGRLADVWAAIALLVIAWSLADLTHFIQLDPAWDLAALISSWIVLLEMIAGAKIVNFRGAVPRKARMVVERLWQTGRGVRKLGVRVAHLCKRMVSVENWVALAVRLIVAIIVLIAVAEVPYAGKTIIHPFSTAGLPNQVSADRYLFFFGTDQNTNDRNKEKYKYLEHALADRVANTLALIGLELRPDVLVAVSPKEDPHSNDSRDDRRVTWISATSEEDDGLEAAVRNGSVSIPGTNGSLPMEFLTAPIQGPIRNLLGIRTIRGSIQADGSKNNKYTLLASSSSGQTWRATNDPRPLNNAGPMGCSNDNQQSEPLSELQLADMLAYQIVSSDPVLTKRGGTSSWRALRPFHDGMVAWKNFELTTDYNDLNTSLAKFREAVCEDPGFALAQYRLGRALTSDGQPDAAVAAYRASLQAYPDFVAGHIALASTLADFDHYYYYPAPVVLGNNSSNQTISGGVVSSAYAASSPPVEAGPPGTPSQKHGRQSEAIRLWRRVIQELDGEAVDSERAAAYAGLCQNVMDWQEDESRKVSEDPCQRENTVNHANSVCRSYVPFFYCKRAEYLYSKLPSTLRADGQIKAARASALKEMGKILDSTGFQAGGKSGYPVENEHTTGWSCDDPKSAPQRGPYTQYALKYYQKALAVLPEDADARCNFAVDSRLTSKDHHPMQDLDADAYMHINRGDYFWREANHQNFPENYLNALDEYQAAISLAPANTEAMNDYANAFWYWRARFPEDRSPALAYIAHQAERFARRANAMTTDGSPAHLITTATLLEVLLGEGRPHEALEVASKVKFPNHAYFDDVLWDLAEANLCAEHSDRAARPPFSGSSNAQEEAGKLFETILRHEEKRESQPFRHVLETLSAVSPHPVCLWSPETALEGLPDSHSTRYKLYEEKLAYSANKPCSWLGIETQMVDQQGKPQSRPAPGLLLQVWGAGIDRYVPLEEESQVVLSFQPRNTHQYYFAQLVNKQEKPMSPVYAIRTFANESNDRCSRNLITLRFLLEVEKPSSQGSYLLAKDTLRR